MSHQRACVRACVCAPVVFAGCMRRGRGRACKEYGLRREMFRPDTWHVSRITSREQKYFQTYAGIETIEHAQEREREREKENGRKKGGGRGRKQDKRRRQKENRKGSTFSLEKKPTRRANEKTKPEGYCFYENRNTFKTRAQKEEEDELKARERAWQGGTASKEF